MAWKTRRTQISNLAEGLAKAGALQFGTFTLPDGRESSYYINLRGILSYPGLYSLAVYSMFPRSLREGSEGERDLRRAD